MKEQERIDEGHSVVHGEMALRPKGERDVLVSLDASPIVNVAEHVAGDSPLARGVPDRRKAGVERLVRLQFLESLNQVERAIQRTQDLDPMMGEVLETLRLLFDCDRARLVYPCDPEAVSWRVAAERTRPQFPANHPSGVDLPADPDSVMMARMLREADGPVTFRDGSQPRLPPEIFRRLGCRSFLSMAICPRVGRPWQFDLHQCSRPRVWTPEEERLFHAVGMRLSDALTGLLACRDLRESEDCCRRLTERLTDYQDASRVEAGRATETACVPEAQLRHAHRLEALGSLAGRVAHDFNNILSVLAGYGALMEQHMSKEDPNLPYLREMLDATDRAIHLTQSLLIFGGKQAAELKRLDLNELLEEDLS